jgi:hypothetical protein
MPVLLLDFDGFSDFSLCVLIEYGDENSYA